MNKKGYHLKGIRICEEPSLIYEEAESYEEAIKIAKKRNPGWVFVEMDNDDYEKYVEISSKLYKDEDTIK